MDCVSARTVVVGGMTYLGRGTGDGAEGDLWLGHRVLPCCSNRDGAGEVAKEQRGEWTACSKRVNDDQYGGDGRRILGARGL
jgi:hypothetical protein